MSKEPRTYEQRIHSRSRLYGRHPTMLPAVPVLPAAKEHRLGCPLPAAPWRALAISGLLLLLLYVTSFNYRFGQGSSDYHRLPFQLNWRALCPATTTAGDTVRKTDLSHVVFGIVGSLRTWKDRKAYQEAWWRPNVTQGYLFLDGLPKNDSLLCPSTCPPLRINDNITNWDIYPKIKYPIQIRMVWSILETFRQGDREVRWFVMADDDSVLFVDNIVDVLSKYDHTKRFYIGGSSETIISNAKFTFEMGFGGAGFALSYPLAAALSKTLDGCIKRYPYMWSADYLTYICILELGIGVSHEKGFHQIDLHGNISGLLSSHPQTPILSLHHINAINPIFPSMNRSASISHLMKPAGVDQSRLVQQTICYQRDTNWSVSVSWGYSAHIYENVHPRYVLQQPIETFAPWVRRPRWPMFMFNTRPVSNNSCEAPHWFFFESIERRNGDDIVTTYGRGAARGLEPCLLGGNHSADHIGRIRVFSPAKTCLEIGRAECCDVLSTAEMNTTTVRIRPCLDGEELIFR